MVHDEWCFLVSLPIYGPHPIHTQEDDNPLLRGMIPAYLPHESAVIFAVVVVDIP